MTGERIEVYCDSCDAVYTVIHNVEEPYKLDYCSFCGEELDDEYMDANEWNKDET